ncbi:fibronectin type III domain-containing protein [Aureimonas sp. AU12]|uniref:fibronectin type III domain-containing protein n=1 Tax=Aureimonas sp. AU12 TaxID=1638161 RepID=UPI0007821055|nr:fibronectin type III domain-containing protein [Aureimonas sp. AU12]
MVSQTRIRQNKTSLAGAIGAGVLPPGGGGVTPPVLKGLTSSISAGAVGSPLSAAISGKTSGSVLSLTGAGAAGLSVSGATVSGTPTAVGDVSVIETLAGAAGSPKMSGPLISVSAAAATVPAAMAAPSLVAGSGQIAVTRAGAPANGGASITGYDILYRTGTGAFTVIAMTSNPQALTGLTNGVLYEVTTRAVNAVGAGPASPSASATPALSVFFADMPLTDSGDSITALKDNSGWLPWAEFLSYGRFALRSGADQAISGSQINEANDEHDVLLRADRRSYYTSQLGPGIAALMAIGTNSIDLSDTKIKEGLDLVWGDATTAGSPNMAATILPSASNQSTSVTTGLGTSPKQRYDSVNAYIRSKKSSTFLVVDGASAWGETYVGHTDTGNLHPNTPGAIKYGGALKAALEDAGYPIGSFYGADGNPADNIIPASTWTMDGTTGTKSGTSTINGTVPTGFTITNSVAGLIIDVSVITLNVPFIVNGSIEMRPMKLLQLDLSGSVTTQGTISILQAFSISPIEQAGATFEHMHYASLSAVDDVSAPSGCNIGSLTNSGSLSFWSNANTAAIAGVIDRPVKGIARGRTQIANAAVGTNGILTQLRVATGTANIRLRYGMGYVRRSERVAYSAPGVVYTARDDLGGPLVGPTFTGTAANGNTLTGRVGYGWKGGEYTFSFQWERTADAGVTVEAISGATAMTYDVSGQTGYQLRLKVTMAATSKGPAVPAYTPWSVKLA